MADARWDGGKLNVTALITTAAGSVTALATMYVTGGSIPKATIQSLLDSYHPQSTQYLFRGVAVQESGYQQFGTVITGAPFVNYGISSTWPDQSPTGMYIGLLQIGPWYTAPAEAFDWTTNVTSAEDLFYGDKMARAAAYNSRYVAACSGKLMALSAAQLELVALSYYGDGAGSVSSKGAYYIPNKACNQWVVNTANLAVKRYVEAVMAKRSQ